jgi:hypothetical protein
MEKQFPEEPLSEKLRLLIDGGNEAGTYALTTDRDRVICNLEQLDLYGQLQTQATASGQGVSIVFDVGRYAAIATVSRDLSRMSMEFFDFRACGDIRQLSAPALFDGYPEPVVRGLEELCSQLAASFREPEDDWVELSRG